MDGLNQQPMQLNMRQNQAQPQAMMPAPMPQQAPPPPTPQGGNPGAPSQPTVAPAPVPSPAAMPARVPPPTAMPAANGPALQPGPPAPAQDMGRPGYSGIGAPPVARPKPTMPAPVSSARPARNPQQNAGTF